MPSRARLMTVKPACHTQYVIGLLASLVVNTETATVASATTPKKTSHPHHHTIAKATTSKPNPTNGPNARGTLLLMRSD